MTKLEKLKVLAAQRRLDDQVGLSKKYGQVGDFHGGVYDTWELVSPWTKSATNLETELMVIGQDWYSEDAILKSKSPWLLGYNPDAPTNKNLFALLRETFGLELSDVYATNLFVFVKPGAANAPIPRGDLLYSAQTYTKKEIDIVHPNTIVCLGSANYSMLCRALEVEALPFKSSHFTPVPYGGSLIYAVPHTGMLGTNQAGGINEVRKIWSKLAKSISSLEDVGNKTHVFDQLNMEDSEMVKAKKESDLSVIPDVIPMYQEEVTEDGKHYVKRFRPLGYSLLSWVKGQGFTDKLDLHEDTGEVAYSFTMDTLDGESQFNCYFNLEENTGLIRYYMYFFDEYFDEPNFEMYKLLLAVNSELRVGQFQLMHTENGYVLRYYSSIDVRGIASEDPEYSGPFQIPPILYERLKRMGADSMNRYLDCFRTGDLDAKL